MMDKKMMSAALRNLSKSIDLVADDQEDDVRAELRDGAELVRVLARVVEGQATIKEAFGSPGDWGYRTPIGEALIGKG